MGPWDSNNEKVKFHAKAWLMNDGPLYVDVYMPHSASSGTPYLISESIQLTNLINDAAPGSVLTIFKEVFVFQGRFDEHMQSSFRDKLHAGEHWWVLEDTYYPDQAEILASGTSWSSIESELMEEPERLKYVFIGKEPDIPNYWVENQAEDIIIIRKKG